jgi:DNA-binding beta-propeller fold protein YncE
MKIITSIVMSLLLFSANIVSGAQLPQKSYTNSYNGKPSPSPDPYEISLVITGQKLGCGNFNSPLDLFISDNNEIYIVDTGNNRIVVLDEKLNYLREYKSAGKHRFNAPQGIFVTTDGKIYVADTENSQIVVMNQAGDLLKTIGRPDNEIYTSVFKPSKVVVDNIGKIHAISLYVNQGIIEFSEEGEFEGFLAAGKVNPNPLELFWKNVSTVAQRDRMVEFVPIEYNNITIDSDGFLYATMAAINDTVVIGEIKSKGGSESGALVRRLNMMGEDILRRRGFFPPVGDVDITDIKLNTFAAYKGISSLVDVSYGDNNTYSVLDNNRKKIFTYDAEGNLLYAFAGPDISVGGFAIPISLVNLKEKIYVLDKGTGALTLFEATEYAQNIAKALNYFDNGKYADSTKAWENVLNKNANFSLAYVGIGKSLYKNKRYKEAMDYFRKGHNKSLYSLAYNEYRKGYIAFWFPIIACLLIGMSLFLIFRNFFKTFKKFIRGELY